MEKDKKAPLTLAYVQAQKAEVEKRYYTLKPLYHEIECLFNEAHKEYKRLSDLEIDLSTSDILRDLHKKLSDGE
jgi:hypothetical protein